jgi:serine/threonine-protein kinase RsbW
MLCVVSATAAFADDERANLAAIADLAAQSIDRARLAALAKRNAERAGFLAEMAMTIEQRRTVPGRAQQVVDLMVPYLADYATVEMADRGAAPVAAAHADAAHLEKLIRLRERENLAGGQGDPAAAAVATGQSQLNESDAEVPPSGGHDDALIPRSSVALPLRGWGDTVGALLLAYSTSERRYAPDDLAFLATLADQVGLALETAHLYERERAVSYTLQHSLMPGELPTDPRAGITVHYESGVGDMEVGGDWHNEFMLDDHTLAVVVGDVVGRGLAAAATMGQLRSAVRALSMAGLGVAAVLDQLERFVEDMPEAHVATLVYAELDLETGTLRWGCAGHPPPLLLAPNAAPSYLWDGRSMPLGVRIANDDRPVGTQTLIGGSVLLLYTDGVVERRDESMEVGLDRLASVAAARTPEPFDSLADDLVEMMQRGRARAEDDVCLVCLSFEGS